jgi:hypothetical protein
VLDATAMVTVILGLCGSGKSTLATELAGQGCALFDEGVFPGYSNWAPFLDAVAEGRDCVVVEVAYNTEDARRFLTQTVEQAKPGTTVKYICFENDLAVANANCIERARRDPTRDALGNCAQNERMSATYKVPQGGEIRRMHRL